MILLLPCAAFAQQNNSYWPLFQSYHFNNEAYHPSAATFNQGHNLYSAYQSRAGLFKEIRDLYFNFEFAVNPQNRTGIVAIIMQEGDYISRNRIGAQHAVSISLNTKSRLNLGIYLGAINQVYSASLSSPRVSGTVLDSKMNLAFQSNSLTISLSLNQFNNPKMHLLTSLDNDPSITFKSNLELLTKYQLEITPDIKSYYVLFGRLSKDLSESTMRLNTLFTWYQYLSAGIGVDERMGVSLCGGTNFPFNNHEMRFLLNYYLPVNVPNKPYRAELIEFTLFIALNVNR